MRIKILLIVGAMWLVLMGIIFIRDVIEVNNPKELAVAHVGGCYENSISVRD